MIIRKQSFWTIGCGMPLLACVSLIVWWILPNILFPLSEYDKNVIESRYQEFCASLASKQYEKTYEFMSSGFRKNHSLESYKQEYQHSHPRERFGLEQACDWHISPEGNIATATLYQWNGRCFFCWDAGAIVNLVKENGLWYIETAVYSVD